MDMIILGIDPGYAIVGYGIVKYESNKFKTLMQGAVITDCKDDFCDRLEEIYNQLDGIIKQLKPSALAIENLYFTTNAKTAIKVAQARGVVLLCAKKNHVPVFEYTPLQVKSAVVGYGKAAKSQVIEMTRILLGLEKAPKPDDVADALAVAICHAHSSSSLLSKTFLSR